MNITKATVGAFALGMVAGVWFAGPIRRMLGMAASQDTMGGMSQTPRNAPAPPN